MSTATSEPPATPDPKPAVRSWGWRGLLVLAVAAALAAGLWYGWRWYATPVPPEVPAGLTDPAVVQAITAARDEVRRNPHSAEAWGKLGMVLQAHAEREPASRCYAEAARHNPEDPRWAYLQGIVQRHLGTPEAALASLRRAVALCQARDEHEVAARLMLAEVLLEDLALDEAAGQLRQAAVLAPHHPRVHFDLGLLAAARGDLPAARQHLLQASHSDLARQRGAAQLASLCQRQGDEQAAADFGGQATQAPPDPPWPDPFLAAVLRLDVSRQGRIKHFQYLASQGRLQEGVQLLRDLVRQYPDAHTSLLLGSTLTKVGELGEAETILRAVVRQLPGEVQAPYDLGLCLYYQGEHLLGQPAGRPQALAKLREAAEYARRATALKPDHAFAQICLGLALKRLGERAEAVRAFRAAVACRPELAPPHFYLGEALAEEGQLTEARKHLHTAVELAPQDARPRQALARLDKQPGASP
jgi:tetratricopeptide (TPR) repeat protein